MKQNYKLLITAFAAFICNLGTQAQFISGGTGKTVLQNINDNVGIGTTNPAFAIDVQRSGNASANFKSSTGTANLIIDRGNNTATSSVSYRTAGSPTWQTGTLGTDNFAIRNIALGNSALSITALTNYVGIGTNAPTAKLQVQNNTLTEVLVKSTTNGSQITIDRSANGYEAVTRYTQTDVPQWKTGLMVNNNGTPDYVINNQITNSDAINITGANNWVNLPTGVLAVGATNTSLISRSGNDLSILPYAPIAGTPGNLILNASTGLFKSGNVSIGTSDATLGKLVVQGAAGGNTVALFRKSASAAGIAIISDWPGVFFNSYWGNGHKAMSAGYVGMVNFDPVNGNVVIGSSATAANAAGDAVSVPGALFVTAAGNVGIGTLSNTYKLNVCGTVRATEVRVSTGWCDYVFADDYALKPLSEVEAFIKENKHLPDVTKGSIIESEGLEVGKTSAQMIKKIEELTLYIIQQQKRMDAMQLQIESLSSKK